MEKKKLRLSYSLLSCWSKSRPEEAISLYLHQDRFVTPAMKIGREIHENIEKHVNLTKTLPTWLSSLKLKSPKSEFKMIVTYNELFDLSAVMDVLDEPTIYEFKTGVSDSVEWANGNQLPFYFLICQIAGITIDRGYLIHYNQNVKTCDWTMVWNGKRAIERARNLIDSVGPEIYEHFMKEGLIST